MQAKNRSTKSFATRSRTGRQKQSEFSKNDSDESVDNQSMEYDDSDDDGADADNENTMVYTRKDLSMANAGRKSARLNQTAKKQNRKGKKTAEEEPHSAGEMDERD